MTCQCRCFPRKACIFLCLATFVVFHILMLMVFLHHRHYSPVLHTADSLTTTRDPAEDFRVQLKGDELKVLLDTMDSFVSALDNASIPFFMYGGTLIGSWRHHGQIPWDDDMDFALPYALKANISEVLNQLQPDYVLNIKQQVRWKLFAANAIRINGVPWKFPFLDMSFYLENDTHIWDEDRYNFKTFCFPKSVVFPLTTRPFEGRHLPAPNDTLAMLVHNYDMDLCQTGNYNHRRETGVHAVKSVHCQHLKGLFPFVKRMAVQGGGCNETLGKSGEVISWYVSPDHTC